MAIRVKRTISIIEGAPALDESKPVFLELTPKLELVFHNYDNEVDTSLEELGFEPSKWLSIYRDVTKHQTSVLADSYSEILNTLPVIIANQYYTVYNKMRDTYYKAARSSTYRTPSVRWVDRAGVTYGINILYLNISGRERIRGEVSKVWHSKYGKRQYPGKHLDIITDTTFVGYKKLLNKIPSGVIFDPKDDSVNLVAAIVKSIDKNTLIVSAGRQGRGLSVEPYNALVHKEPDGQWYIQKWIKR